MAKHKLVWEDDYDFELIGICSSYADYRLCWSINQIDGLNLEKGEYYSLLYKKDGEALFAFYEYYNNDTLEEVYLIKNQSDKYKKLIPEQDKIDYFLIIKNNYNYQIDNLISDLKKQDSILTAFSFSPEELKSKANLIF